MREQTSLRFDPPAPRPRTRSVSGPARPLGVVAQVRRAFASGKRLATEHSQ